MKISNELQYEDEVAQAGLQNPAGQKRYCTSCQTDRSILGGILQPYKTGSVIRRRWKRALCANELVRVDFLVRHGNRPCLKKEPVSP